MSNNDETQVSSDRCPYSHSGDSDGTAKQRGDRITNVMDSNEMDDSTVTVVTPLVYSAKTRTC